MPDKLNVPNRSMFTGDNLDILRGLNSNSFDLIYADPPRNSGKPLRAGNTTRARGFVFKDEWTADDAHPEWEDEIAVRQPDAMHIINAFRLIHDEGMVNYLVFLAVRLLELQRVLKPSGGIYLHCRPDSAHGIKAIMNAIFGSEQFRNDIAFRRYGDAVPSGGDKRWKWSSDKILFYAGPSTYTWHKVPQPYPAEYFASYVYEDERGKYQSLALAHNGLKSDDRGIEWRGYNPSKHEQNWSVPMGVLRQLYPDRSDLDGLTAPEKLDLLEAVDMIHWSDNPSAPPRYKKFADDAEGDVQSDVVATIGNVRQHSREDSGWPEQVPAGLLELIINSSTDEGDIVLDPFSGSGTACIVAERLKRRWVGIEQAPQGYSMLVSRLRRELKMQYLPDRDTRPRRTDDKEPSDLAPGPRAKRTLYERQAGKCNGCQHELPEHVLEIDMDKRSLGAPAALANLQLLCHYCRVLRGRHDMNYLGRMVYETRVHKALDTRSYQ